MARAGKRSTRKPIARTKPRTKSKPKPKAKPARLTAADKRRKLAAAKGAATRKRNEMARREAESKAFRAKLAKKARLKKKRERKAKATARQLATRAKKGGKSLLAQLEGAYGTMAETSPYPLAVSIERSPVMDKGRQPWLLQGTFIPEGLGWAEVGEICKRWEDDLILETTINSQRYSFIRFLYQRYDEDGDPVGEPQGYSATSSGPWGYVISETVGAIIGDEFLDDDSLAVLYENTAILEIQVLWSASLQ